MSFGFGRWLSLAATAFLIWSSLAQGATSPASAFSTSRYMNPVSATEFSLLIKKAERKLYVYRQQAGQAQLFKQYDVVLGRQPVGHKKQQGDGATPEGDYYLTHKNAKSKFYLSLGLSYPNAHDAAAGLTAGLLAPSEYEAILGALRQQVKPPQNTKLGGDIFIHGGGLGSDWTQGCVALENPDIKELFDLLPVKTPVKILP